MRRRPRPSAWRLPGVGHPQFRHFAVDPAVSHRRILLRQPDDKAGDPGNRSAGRARLIPRSRWTEVFAVAPATLLAWHRKLAASKYELRDQPREPGPTGRIRRRPPQVLIDHHHPGGRPAQRGRPVGQTVLQPRRLTVIQDLLARRLPSCSPPVPSASGMGETASRSRSMLSNPRMSFRVTSGNDLHSSPSETVVTAVIWRRCPHPHRPLPLQVTCRQPLSPLHQPQQALPAGRAYTRPSNAHALWRTD